MHRRKRKHYFDWSRTRHPFLILVFLLLLISLYGFLRVHASGSVQENSIIPSDYRDEGDTSQWPLDLRYATNTASRTIYRDGKIYLQLYSCSWQKNSWSGDYILRYFIRKSDGTVIWLPDVDRGAMLNDWSNVQNVMGVTLHKSFWMAPMELPGAKPEMPEVVFENRDNYQVSCTLTGKANTAAGTYHYDYHAYHRTKRNGSFVPDGGTAANATDYLTGIWYRIDGNSGTVPFQGFQRLASQDASGRTTSMRLDIPSDCVNTEETQYLHIVSQSYTGQYSEMRTVAIPTRGVHHLRYDLNGGKGDFPEQRIICGKTAKIHEGVPEMEGYTFTGWCVSEDACCPDHRNHVYQPGEAYEHRQENGIVTLRASWRPNRYRLIYHGNSRNGANGTILGSMQEEEKNWTDCGISANGFRNETLQEDGRARYRFRGWAFREDAMQADLPVDMDAEGNGTETIKKESSEGMNAGNGAIKRGSSEGTNAGNGGVKQSSENKKDILNSSDPGKIEIKHLAKALGLENADGAAIHLYAVWDQAPQMTGKRNAYFNHAPSRGELLDLVSATDREDLDGRAFRKSDRDLSLTSGWEEKQVDQIFLLDWTAEEMQKFGECGSVDLTFRAADSGGNLTDLTITVWVLSDRALRDGSEETADSGRAGSADRSSDHLTDRSSDHSTSHSSDRSSDHSTSHSSDRSFDYSSDHSSVVRRHSYVRFIDVDNYGKSAVRGGLRKNSVWRKNPEYKALLERTLEE